MHHARWGAARERAEAKRDAGVGSKGRSVRASPAGDGKERLSKKDEVDSPGPVVHVVQVQSNRFFPRQISVASHTGTRASDTAPYPVLVVCAFARAERIASAVTADTAAARASAKTSRQTQVLSWTIATTVRPRRPIDVTSAGSLISSTGPTQTR
jgi:hypothetical protein